MVKNKQLATFLAHLNNKQAHHIGYCGENVEEIKQTLQEDFGKDAFEIAYDDGQITAAIGLDIDGTSAEVWGPFIKEEDHALLLTNMWQQLLEKNPTIKEFQFFINEQNKLANTFVNSINAQQIGQHAVLLWQQQDQQVETSFIFYEPHFYEAFAELHNAAFPNTYYNADTIIKRLNDENELLLLVDEIGQLQGYAYIEVDNVHKEAAIEYIAIAPTFWRQGLGTKLLSTALARISTTHQIPEVQLTVGKTNDSALRLYIAAGFTVKHELISYHLRKD
ncbi:GNAT family N-acetyltransferase [Bacillus ndiopicus]|uniref:GNAT family N-acetyltransferase n=1 Tax=Bacillus ndiopicus TaxID=1347368 RepID=UPI0005A70D51|nr:N-acetyltransferase [Bacillus ndiopicus]